MIIVVYGPPASGKTRNAEYLKAKYGCKRIVDEHHLGDTRPLMDGDLVLSQVQDGWTKDVTVISIEEALK